MFRLPPLSPLLTAAFFTLLLTLLTSALFSQPSPPSDRVAEPAASERNESATDDATLNLHRWGAVTLFHGLPSDRVYAIAEDANGALWFGTDNGLVRYDGRRIQAVGGEEALPSKRIRALHLDAGGGLWVGTDAGAARLVGERVEVLPEARGRTVRGIAESPQGEVTLVTKEGEIIRYRAAESEITRPESKFVGPLVAVKLGPDSQPLLKIEPHPSESHALVLTSVTFTQAGEWWIGTLGRGALANRDREVRPAVLRPSRPYLIAAVYAEPNRIWLGEQASERVGGLWVYSGNGLTRSPLDTGAVTSIHGGGDEVWVGTNTQGVFLLKGGKPVEHLTFENTAGGLRSNHVNAVFRDHEGVVWFGTDRGVCRYDRDSFRAAVLRGGSQHNFVRALLDTTGGEAWCGTNRGLFRLAAGADLNSWSEVTEVQGRAVYALAEDGAGAVWVGTSSGLFVRPKGASAFTRFAPERVAEDEVSAEAESGGVADETASPPAVLSRESIRAIAIFRGRVYLAVFGRGIERIDEGRRTPVIGGAAAQNALCLAAEGEAALWVGAATGEVLRFDGSQMTPLILSDGQAKWGGEHAVRAITAAGGRIWLGTEKGLYTWTGGKAQPIIPDTDVRSLLEVREANGREVIWCGTQRTGLTKLLAGDGLSITFDTEQGLASQQVFALAPGSGERSGAVWVGTNRGMVLHRPSQVEPRLEVRRLVADKVYLPEDLIAEQRLPYTYRNFLLEVVALGSRTFPSQFQYEFTLKHRDGRVLKNLRTADAQFAVEGLAPGPYLIEARAISRDLVYSSPVAVRLRIPNAPFPWSTLLLGSLLTVAVVAAVWAYRQHRRTARANRELEETNEELRETRIRLARETESERSRIARDLHDQTLADLRHLLVLTDQLNAPVADGVTPPLTPATLRREIEAISSEIRHICEDLSPSVLENIGFLPALEWALTDAVAHLPPDEKFTYEFVCEPELEERLELSPTEQIQLYRLVQEAINNVCRHARANQVRLVVRAENRHDLVIEVIDDGVGFKGAPPAANKTGHGIANIRSRANLIGAQIEWRGEGAGCHFEVRKARCVK